MIFIYTFNESFEQRQRGVVKILEYIKKSLPEGLYIIFVNIYGCVINLILKVLGLLPLKNKIIFISYYGKGIECNPKYIYEELNLRKCKYKLYWALTDNSLKNGKNNSINCIKYRGLMFYYHLATAKLWISNVRLPYYWPKRHDQLYIQTWHSGIGLKKSEADAQDSLSKVYVRHAIHDASITDLMVSNSTWETDLYKRAFWYKGEILESGLPREDCFSLPSHDIKIKVCDFYKINYNDHLVLYAPTFRRDGNMNCYNIDLVQLVNSLNEKWSGEWKVIIRLHPNIKNKQSVIQYNDTILNGSTYEDINDLIIASDIVISDYSSCMFDGLLAKKKVFLYATDIEDYKKDRGMLFEFQELPFSLATNNHELINEINKFNEELYVKKCNDFKKRVGLFELGSGSKKVVDWIDSKLGILTKN